MHSGCMDKPLIDVEVVYALPREQVVVQLALPANATVESAIHHSGLLTRYPDIADAVLQKGNLGIFGKTVKADTLLKAHDRVEIYRPLSVDPKEARRRRVRLRAGKQKNV